MYSAMFLGVGASSAIELGNSSLLISRNESPFLLIDCGYDTLFKYRQKYGEQALPPAVYITHCHFDHVGGLEQLYYLSRFNAHRPFIFVSHHLVSILVKLLSNTTLSETDENVWDVLQLVPVDTHFFFQKQRFDIFEVRHHSPKTAFGICLPGQFLYTGDTRPIPEVVLDHTSVSVIFHDCAVTGNPSHTGIDDLLREYSEDSLNKMILYHYHSMDDIAVFASHSLKCAVPFRKIELNSTGALQELTCSVSQKQSLC